MLRGADLLALSMGTMNNYPRPIGESKAADLLENQSPSSQTGMLKLRKKKPAGTIRFKRAGDDAAMA